MNKKATKEFNQLAEKQIELVKEMKRNQEAREKRLFVDGLARFAFTTLIILSFFFMLAFIFAPREYSFEIRMDNNTLQAVESLNETIQSVATEQFKITQGKNQCLKDCEYLFHHIACKDCSGVQAGGLDWFYYPSSCEEYCNNQTR